MKRVVITGMGSINALGKNIDETWEAMKAGKNGIKYLPEELTKETKVHVAGTVDYDANEYFNRKEQRVFDKSSQFAIIAAREAAKQANLDQVSDRSRIGVNMTSGIGGLETIEKEIINASEKGMRRLSPLFIPKALVNLVAGNVAIDLDLHGPVYSPVTACASSTDAIGQAYFNIQNGLADVMIAGGSESAICAVGLAGFKNMHALSPSEDINNASVPFSKERSGFVMGEGAGALVVEDLEHALARGAEIYGEVIGYGCTCDASHITAPDATGTYAKKAVENAVNMANLTPEDINFVNAHGTSTPLNDDTESKVMGEVFTESKPYVTSSKSMTGHLLGAAGAVEAINVLKSIEDKVVTPTINNRGLCEAAEVQNLNVCTELVNDDEIKYGLSTSLGFGGHNAAIILSAYKGE